MIIIKINNLDEVSDSAIKKIAKIIAEEKIAILPTSTIYGLSCRYDSKKSIGKIYEIKKRNKNMPFIILISGKDDIRNLASDISRAAEKIIERFWDIENPRPLTLIFKKSGSLENFITSGSPYIAIRLAGSAFLKNIIRICGPIVSTSATISGVKTHPKKIKDIPDTITKQVDLIVECSSALAGTESTIIDVAGRVPVLVREGAVNFKDIFN